MEAMLASRVSGKFSMAAFVEAMLALMSIVAERTCRSQRQQESSSKDDGLHRERTEASCCSRDRCGIGYRRCRQVFHNLCRRDVKYSSRRHKVLHDRLLNQQTRSPSTCRRNSEHLSTSQQRQPTLFKMGPKTSMIDPLVSVPGIPKAPSTTPYQWPPTASGFEQFRALECINLKCSILCQNR